MKLYFWGRYKINKKWVSFYNISQNNDNGRWYIGANRKHLTKTSYTGKLIALLNHLRKEEA